MPATIRAAIIAVTVISLIPQQLMSGPIASVVDSTVVDSTTDVARFESDKEQLITTGRDLAKRMATYLAMYKLAKQELLSDPGLVDAKEGKVLLLDSYVLLGKVTALLYNLEQAEDIDKSESRTNLLELIKVLSEALLIFSTIVEDTDPLLDKSP